MNCPPRMVCARVLAGCLLVLLVPALALAQPETDAPSLSPQEAQTRLREIAKAPELTAEQAAVFEQLAASGTAELIPVLVPMLTDDRLAHYARFALEANPDAAVDALFRESLGPLKGRLLIGVINSMGVRRDAEATPALAALLTDTDAGVSAAAANALGCIATPAAAEALTAHVTSVPATHRDGVARGCVVCAENLHRAGARDQAMALYDVVRQAEVLPSIRLAALRGAILTRGEAGIPLLVEHLQGSDPGAVDTALRAARELDPRHVLPALAEGVGQLPPPTASRVILALGEMGDPQALPTVLAALAAESTAMRAAAIRSLRHLGTAQNIPALWEVAAGPDDALAELARETLAALPGEESDRAIVGELDNADAASRLVAVDLVGRRRIEAAVPKLMQLASSADGATRRAAIVALGETTSLDTMSVLVDYLVAASNESERSESAAALTAACVRMPDRDGCARMLTSKLPDAPAEVQTILLEQLGAMGGPVALECLAASAQDDSPATQDAATRILGTWIGSDVGPVLLDLAGSIHDERYKIRVLRGYIRIANQFGLPHDEKMDMCEKALAAAHRDDERALVLDVLARDPSPLALRIAVTQLANPALKTRAADVAVGIAQTAIQDDPRGVVAAMREVIRAGVGGDTETRAQGYLERAQNMH